MRRALRFQTKNTSKPASTLLVVGWAVLCFLLGIGLVQAGLKTKNAFVARQKAEEALEVERQKNKDLQQKIQDAQEPFSQEKIIRDELNMQKPGEVILLLPSPTP